ncbi:DUF421 domain-containing protein [Alkalihalobacillus sp. AL-G]|uniref:YetF domain-containing protein n=1 Tax=Alkalihalobacillus sp. AL-G TaxID=2926399 RepID=UPI00272CD35B|nr:DUF421 domain-containing protein [Alkalihalobacillus sp. AL-G]WLD91908.1 DUF421 domain-containing protein [Alkalihalobacillus sp. AL-G]
MPWDVVLKTILGFSVLLFLIRILGKKQLGQITYFTYITGVAMGNIAGDMVVHKDITIGDGITALVMWAILTLFIEIVSLNSGTLRGVLDGEPTIVIKKGKIQQSALRKNKLNMDDLTMLLRTKDVFSIKDVDYAILEPNGQISILKKVSKESPTKDDLNLPVIARGYLPTEIIVDGKIVNKNLQEYGRSVKWLFQELKYHQVDSLEDVFFAELQEDGSLEVIKKESKQSGWKGLS